MPLPGAGLNPSAPDSLADRGSFHFVLLRKGPRQERAVDQFDIDAAVLGGLDPVGDLHQREGGGVYSTLDVPGSTATFASGINDAGQIVGDYYNSAGLHGFLYSNGVYTTIDAVGVPQTNVGGGTSPSGINEAGQIVGYYSDPTI